MEEPAVELPLLDGPGISLLVLVCAPPLVRRDWSGQYWPGLVCAFGRKPQASSLTAGPGCVSIGL